MEPTSELLCSECGQPWEPDHVHGARSNRARVIAKKRKKILAIRGRMAAKVND